MKMENKIKFVDDNKKGMKLQIRNEIQAQQGMILMKF
jgi:hypothetical protein